MKTATDFSDHIDKEIIVWERNPCDRWKLYEHLKREARKKSECEEEYEQNMRDIIEKLEL